MTEGLRADAIDGAFRPRLRSTVASVELDGEAVLYDTDSGHTHLLNPTATVIWGCLDGETTVDELIADLAVEYGVDAPVIAAEVVELIKRFGEQGLLVGVEPMSCSDVVERSPIDDDVCAD